MSGRTRSWIKQIGFAVNRSEYCKFSNGARYLADKLRARPKGVGLEFVWHRTAWVTLGAGRVFQT
jgi:hypothetical protein